MMRLWTRIAAVVALGVAVAAAAFVYDHFYRAAAPFFASDEDHFLFGSIGNEDTEGIPYWIWLVLPRIFPEYLPSPGGYAALGALAKDGSEMPIGFTKVTIGFERVGTNCALCHTASYRLRPDDPPTIVPTAPAHQLALQPYLRFLSACASDPRFTADTILGEIAKNVRLSASERLVYRFVVIPSTRRAILRRKDRDAWMHSRTDWGRGRIDAVDAFKFGPLGLPVDRTVGTADAPPLWNIGVRGRAYGWDGSNADLKEVVLASAAGSGAESSWIDRDDARWNATDPHAMSSLRRVLNYLDGARPPKFPLPIDQALASQGATVFQDACASCHAPSGPRFGTVIPAGEIGTDPRRAAAWTSDAAIAFNQYGSGHAWKFSHSRGATGYVAGSLDGVWLRAPYLHNGSVPSLGALLQPSMSRPKRFWRGYDVYDARGVGFVADGDAARGGGTLFDTTQPGNGNAGHLYGTALRDEDKRALIEYLKTR